MLTDREAIERFTSLHGQHYRRVYAYAVSRAGRQVADEIVSEVFLIAWRRRAELPEPEREDSVLTRQPVLTTQQEERSP